MIAEAFDTALIKAFTKPPVDDGDPDGFYAHQYLGRHATFRGRRYRRGKLRCHRCGARMDAKDGLADPDRHLTVHQRIVKHLTAPNPLLRYLRRRA